MAMHIANYQTAQRLTAVALESMTSGMVVKVAAEVSGQAGLLKLADGDTAAAGKYGIVMKVDVRAEAVETTSIASTNARLGGQTRLSESIVSGELVVLVGRGAIAAYKAADLHSSLDAARSGATPTVGDVIKVKDAQFCSSGTGGANASVPAVVREMRGTDVLIELLA